MPEQFVDTDPSQQQPHIDQVAQTPEYLVEALNELPKKPQDNQEKALTNYYKARDAAVGTIVQHYEHHPEVLSRIDAVVPPDKLAGFQSTKGSELRTYLDATNKLPRLSAPEERSLLVDLEQGLAIYNKRSGNVSKAPPEDEAAFVKLSAAQKILYLTNLRFVALETRQYFGTDMLSSMELIQEGNIGLAMAINRFDVTRDNRFSSYAEYWVSHKIRIALAEKSRTIRITHHEHDKWLQLGRKETALTTDLHRSPTDKELADALNISVKSLQALRIRGSMHLMSLDQPPLPGDHEDVVDLHQILATDVDFDAINTTVAAAAKVGDVFINGGLDKRAKTALALRYGLLHHLSEDTRNDVLERLSPLQRAKLLGREGLSLRQIGSILGFTATHAERIIRKAQKDIKAQSVNDNLFRD